MFKTVVGVTGPDEEALCELVRSLERFPSLFSHGHDAVRLYRPDGTLVAGNDASRTLIGEEFGDFNSRRHIDGAELERAQAYFQSALSGRPAEFETVLLSRDGEPINVLARLFPALVDGKIVGVFGTARDITLQRQAEASRDESRERFRSLFEQHPDSISMIDTRGRYLKINAATERMVGCRSEELEGKKVGDVFPPGDQEAVDETVLSILLTGKPARYERSVVRKDGTRLSIEGTAVPIVVDERVTGVFLMSRDVTERTQTEEALVLLTHRRRALQRRFVETGADPDVQANSVLAFGQKELGFESGWVVTAGNPFAIECRAGTILPFDAEDPVLRRLFQETIAASEPLEAGEAALSERSELGGPAAPLRSFVGLPLDVANKRYGALAFASASATAPLNESDLEFLRSVAELISANIERVTEEKRLQGLAHYDALTGLPNRLLLNDRFNVALASAQRRGEQLAVYFVDVDKFKAINDAHGHLAGDEVLRTVARRLNKACRASDTVARLGGDEFIVLQCGMPPEGRSDALAARLRSELEVPCEIEGLQLDLSVCIGISVFPRDGQDQRTLLKNADTALYAAKAAGPGSICRYWDGIAAAAQLASSLERRSRHASKVSI